MKKALQSIAAALAISVLLSLTACGEKSSGKIPDNESNVVQDTPTVKEDLPSEESRESEPLSDETTQTFVDLLRECMDGANMVGAVAYLGYRDENERNGDLTDWLWTYVPGLMEDMLFLEEIPPECVLNGDYGDLYCIVPREENTSMAVNHIVWRSTGNGVWPKQDEVLYRSEYAEPLLLFVRWEEFQDEPDVEVIAVTDSGTEMQWYPKRNMEDGGYIVLPTGENYEPLLLDFSSFSDVSGLDYGDDGWFPPTDIGLADTIWNCGSWMLELHYSDGDPDYAGAAELYFQATDGQEYQLAYSGVWRMEMDCLYLELSAGVGTSVSGNFPVLVNPAGENLLIEQDRDTNARLPFFDNGATSMELTLSYG